jgi:uncharacterized protein
MRIAIDSSVLIASYISRAGVCAQLLEEVLLNHELVTSEFILEELGRKLVEKVWFSPQDADEVASFLRRVSIVVQPTKLPAGLCRDANDIPVLGTAIAGDCTLLISVDRDLLDLCTVEGISIVRPGEYWRQSYHKV